ncbi:MAG: hypothetical protein SFV32_12810 [Opitutaceae bacterium]|nr:hypothetical protein [Opitutaceae bacterium]
MPLDIAVVPNQPINSTRARINQNFSVIAETLDLLVDWIAKAHGAPSAITLANAAGVVDLTLAGPNEIVPVNVSATNGTVGLRLMKTNRVRGHRLCLSMDLPAAGATVEIRDDSGDILWTNQPDGFTTRAVLWLMYNGVKWEVLTIV